MTVAQGINKLSVFKMQTVLGTPAVGGGGQVLRRKTSVASANRASYINDEIVQHQQSTGVNLGTASTAWAFDGLLSPGTFAPLMGSLLRKIFTATAAVTAASITIGGTAGAWTLTDGANTFLTKGVKIGDVVRVTAGAYTNAVNRDNNILVTGVTQTVITGATLNNSVLITEGPVAASTITVIGKKSLVPLTGHTDQLFTLEEWYPDIVKSELFPDMRVSQIDIGLPASGNATIKLSAAGLGVRTNGVAQALTAPTSTTSPVLTAVRGLIRVNNAASLVVTGLSFSIKTALSAEGPVVGSNFAPDMARGRIEVSGSFTSLFDSTTLRDLYDAETLISLSVVMAGDTTNAADFVGFTISAVKITDADPDDGEKAIVRTYTFYAAINVAGGAALANDQTIITVQDSLA